MDDNQPVWIRSTFCSNGACVQVARSGGNQVLVRDSKLEADSPVLVFSPAEWADFVGGLRND